MGEKVNVSIKNASRNGCAADTRNAPGFRLLWFQRFFGMPVFRDSHTNGLYHVFGCGQYRYTMKAQKAVVGLCRACVGVRCFRSRLEGAIFSGYGAGTQAKENKAQDAKARRGCRRFSWPMVSGYAQNKSRLYSLVGATQATLQKSERLKVRYNSKAQPGKLLECCTSCKRS